MLIGTCDECIYWDQSGDSEGMCRRHAPVRPGYEVRLGSEDYFGDWLWTSDHDWCGEFVERCDDDC